jgi:hypothetical protein
MFNDKHEEARKAALRRMIDEADNTIEARRQRAIEALGERWVCHPSKAPKKGVYNPVTGKFLRDAA